MSAKCKFCGQDGLQWTRVDDKWRLHRDGAYHSCKQYRDITVNRKVPASSPEVSKPKQFVGCDYCYFEAELVSGDKIYPHRGDLFSKMFWRCVSCDAYVGCHPGTSQPLGRLANAELRRAKQAAHKAFDPLWQSGKMSRTQAYRRLAEQMGMSQKECHIGMFTTQQCEEAIKAVLRIAVEPLLKYRTDGYDRLFDKLSSKMCDQWVNLLNASKHAVADTPINTAQNSYWAARDLLIVGVRQASNAVWQTNYSN
jgi:hypothetical protein